MGQSKTRFLTVPVHVSTIAARRSRPSFTMRPRAPALSATVPKHSISWDCWPSASATPCSTVSVLWPFKSPIPEVQAMRPRAPLNAPCFANAARSRCCAAWCEDEVEGPSVSRLLGRRVQHDAFSRRGLGTPWPAGSIVTMRGAPDRFLLR